MTLHQRIISAPSGNRYLDHALRNATCMACSHYCGDRTFSSRCDNPDSPFVVGQKSDGRAFIAGMVRWDNRCPLFALREEYWPDFASESTVPMVRS